MTLDELRIALTALLEEGVPPDEPVCVQWGNEQLQAKSIAVVVHSDLWVPQSVVMDVEPVDEGEADDG